MAIESDLKIFISWSGELARECTKVLRAWLPKMFDHIDPWASEVDIDAGTRGLDAIQDRLNASSFGIIVVTTENRAKPWLNFEAGALSKRLEGDSARVVPLLVNFDDVYQLQGPISQFQAIKLDKQGMAGLCRSIAAVMGLDSLTIDSRFEWAWPDLELAIKVAKESVGQQPAPPEPDEADLLKGLLNTVRALERKVDSLSAARPLDIAFHDPDSPIVSAHIKATRKWSNNQRTQFVRDQVERIASQYKPVRWVRPHERDGEKLIAIMFEDGRGLSSAEFNALMRDVAQFDVAVSVETDRDDK